MYKMRGFTIVELLIVIVIIAILAAITITAFNGITLRSQASKVASDLKSIEKAFLLYKESQAISPWPIDNDATYLSGNANPSISAIITTQPEFRKFLNTAPVIDGMGTSTLYRYDNDGDTYNGCGANSNGVNIYVADTTNDALIQAVDDAIDDGNMSCGKVRKAGTSFHYSISRTQP